MLIRYLVLGQNNAHDICKFHAGIITLFFHWDDRNIYFKVTYCSPKDSHSRRKAKEVLNGRSWSLMPRSKISLKQNKTSAIIADILAEILRRGNFPSFILYTIKERLADNLLNSL